MFVVTGFIPLSPLSIVFRVPPGHFFFLVPPLLTNEKSLRHIQNFDDGCSEIFRFIQAQSIANEKLDGDTMGEISQEKTFFLLFVDSQFCMGKS